MANFFNNIEEEYTTVAVENGEEGEDPSLIIIELSHNRNKEITRLKSEKYGVNGDTNPAPENNHISAGKDDEVTYHE